MLVNVFDNQPPFRLIVPKAQEGRLAKLCFRDKRNLAGNFCEWQSARDLTNDLVLFPLFVASCSEQILEDRAKNLRSSTFSFTLEHPEFPVGWTSTVPWSQLPVGTALEHFKPNRWTQAWRVVDRTLPAPLTRSVSFICDTSLREEVAVVIVQSMYPGPDVALGYGRSVIIDPTKAVFFDWENPGVV